MEIGRCQRCGRIIERKAWPALLYRYCPECAYHVSHY
jgi:phage FluMu protein Com